MVKSIPIIATIITAVVLALTGSQFASRSLSRTQLAENVMRETALVVRQQTASSAQPAVAEDVRAVSSDRHNSVPTKPLSQGLLSKAVSTADAQEEPAANLQVLAGAGTPDPVTLRIPSIQLVAPIVKTGLEKDGSLHVPSSPDQTGWYSLGTKPGDIGPAVITGHYDSRLGPGVLYHLQNVKTGDQIQVVRDDGTVAVFVVQRLALYPQDNFATQEVYGTVSTAGLRIITCAGTYSKKTGHYSDDLVVYATLSQVLIPGVYQPL